MGKIYDGIIGLVVGDALGVLAEWIAQIARRQWIEELLEAVE